MKFFKYAMQIYKLEMPIKRIALIYLVKQYKLALSILN